MAHVCKTVQMKKQIIFTAAILFLLNGLVAQDFDPGNEISFNSAFFFGSPPIGSTLSSWSFKEVLGGGIRYQRNYKSRFFWRSELFYGNAFRNLLGPGINSIEKYRSIHLKTGAGLQYRYKFLEPFLVLDVFAFRNRYLGDNLGGGCWSWYKEDIDRKEFGGGLSICPGLKLNIGKRFFISIEGALNFYYSYLKTLKDIYPNGLLESSIQMETRSMNYSVNPFYGLSFGFKI